MILDSWKRLYSNTPAAKFNEICINGLWNGADIPNSPTQEVSTLQLCGCVIISLITMVIACQHTRRNQELRKQELCPLLSWPL